MKLKRMKLQSSRVR